MTTENKPEMTGAMNNERNDAARSGHYKHALLFRPQRLGAEPLITSCRHVLNTWLAVVPPRARSRAVWGLALKLSF